MVSAEAGWALIVHGGAKEIESGEEEENRAGVLEAVEAGRAILAGGGSAVDAVEAAIRTMEDLPVFNAGRGSSLNAAGQIEMDAGLMDGRDRSAGAVAVIRNVRNPISVAKALLPEKEVLLAGDGALLFAKEQGLELASDDELRCEPVREHSHDTVGAVALDSGGNLAAGTSTGGLGGSRAGRIGDSPLPGSGLYADNHIGAVALSGDGESITRLVVAAQVMASIGDDGPEAAIAKALGQLTHVGGDEGDGGAIAIGKDGRIGWAHTSPAFPVALATSEAPEPRAWLRKSEDDGSNG